MSAIKRKGPGRPATGKPRKKFPTVGFSATEVERAQLDTVAAAAGLSLAEWVRRACADALAKQLTGVR